MESLFCFGINFLNSHFIVQKKSFDGFGSLLLLPSPTTHNVIEGELVAIKFNPSQRYFSIRRPIYIPPPRSDRWHIVGASNRGGNGEQMEPEFC